MSEKFNLSWHTFANHTNELYSDLYNTKKYADVTFVCDDQTIFKAHKFIVSACSPVLRNIVDIDLNQTTIYLRGITSHELEPILQFMYLGEATIHQERMGEFLNVARDLNLKEIGNHVDESYDKVNDVNYVSNFSEEAFIDEHNFEEKNMKQNKLVSVEDEEDKKLFQCSYCVYKSSHAGTLNRHVKAVHEGVKYQCQHCNFEAKQTFQLKAHVKRNH